MALLSEDREKASEARQLRFTKNLFDVKPVFPFCASSTGVVSPLPYAVVDSATLHNLKEAPVIRTVDPFTGADLCKHRVAEHRDGGSGFNTIRPFTAPACGSESAPDDKFSDTAPVQCVTLTAQSGKVTHAALSIRIRQLNCASPRLESDTAFSGHFTHKENMNRYRGGSGRSGG